ncbi:transcriptional repressor [Novibacillus thermophilus]|jgi:Fur family ferric uptake transcriptional regulator|uniref:Transcriptional repressor n=1 Tax=Novibacillus thermophilus TaxID=1471761 RepID=A0A1U9K971_9BACL|nr:transcriptional repressor [Novibacillus thermophilus]
MQKVRRGGSPVLDKRIEKIKNELHEKSYKLTPQREATLRVLLENEEKHLSAEDVYLLVKEKAPEIGLATVYRTLELLSDLQIVHKLNFGDGVARYEFRADDKKHHHHHLICLNCGSVDEIKEDWLETIEKRVEDKYHFKIVDHHLMFHGICHRCRDKVNDEDSLQIQKVT